MEFQEFDKYTAISGEHGAYLRELADYVSRSPYRPNAHICPPSGLLNDPNGLCWYAGWYHVFYQWYPFGPSHGMKHWAHVRSRDLNRWEWCDGILIPTQSYEKNGCYSGNALVNPKDGNCYLFYTANYKTDGGRIPKQALAIMGPDGSISKYGQNPVIDGAPQGMGGDIRDPFVFEQDGSYRMLLGGTDLGGKGRLILYSSENLLDWSYRGIIRIMENGKEVNLGTMVECPGYIRADGQDVLFLSLIGLEPQGDRFRNRFTSLALTGRLDLERMEFRADWSDEPDCGFDFYAPQPFYGKDGVPMIFGWFGCGEQTLPEDRYHWRHGLTLPRELHVRNGRLHTVPDGTTAALFGPAISIPAHPDGFLQPGAFSCVHWAFVNDGLSHTLKIGKKGDYWSLTADMSAHTVTLDRSTLKIPVDPPYGQVRRCRFESCSRMDIRIYMDNSFVEIYVQDGEKVLSARIYES